MLSWLDENPPERLSCGYRFGGGDADVRARLVQQRLARADVGPLARQLRRQAQRQLGRQLQVGKPQSPGIGATAGGSPA